MKNDKEFKELKQKEVDKIVSLLQQRGREIHDNNEVPQQQLASMDVLIDTIKFLEHYEENVKILNQHLKDKRFNREEER